MPVVIRGNVTLAAVAAADEYPDRVIVAERAGWEQLAQPNLVCVVVHAGCPQFGHKEIDGGKGIVRRGLWFRSRLLGRLAVIGRALDGKPGRWDSDFMTQAVKKLLEEFDALQEGDRAEVLAELLRRIPTTPHDLPDADDLVVAADQIFVELDRREQSQ
jgi:hypothetical protein